MSVHAHLGPKDFISMVSLKPPKSPALTSEATEAQEGSL